MWNQLFPDRASTIANDIDLIFAVVTGLALLFAVPVAALVIYFAIRYRRSVPRVRFSDVHEGRGENQTWLLEIAWIVIPLILALAVFTWGARMYLTLYAMPSQGMDVYVVGKQWMWKFQHPTGHIEIDELHVPVGFPVRLTMISEDVIHSFYVPAFRIKRDVIPGKYTTVWFEATKAGIFDLYCAEYCGTDHSRMLARVIVMEAAQYQQWLSEHGVGGGTSAIAESATSSPGEQGTTPTMADAGAQLFQDLGCQSCHREDGAGVGPSLVGLWGEQVELEDGQTVLADIDYVRRSILDPHAQIVAGYAPLMPTYEGQIDEEQLLTLVEYIRSLTEPEAAGMEGPGSEDARTEDGASEDGVSEENTTQEGSTEVNATEEDAAGEDAAGGGETEAEVGQEEEQE